LGGHAVGQDGGNALGGECTDLKGAGQHRFGARGVRSRSRRNTPRQVRKPCSACGRCARMAVINPSVCEPTDAAQRRKRSGVQSG
jgi:hypothetical protein